ncbi:hypothetical protein Mithridates_00002 [Acinetobacter phage Mithridates]|nr:hypothetical protein Mithridates_00002 [Acinetobacter phage Mithridates]
MSVLSDWYSVPEVRAIEDKIKADCIGMNMSICMHSGVEYEVHCAFRDVVKHQDLLRKLAKISMKSRVRGRFTVTSNTLDGNILSYTMVAW